MYAMAGLIPKKDALNQFGMQTITVLMIITLVLVIMMEVRLYKTELLKNFASLNNLALVRKSGNHFLVILEFFRR